MTNDITIVYCDRCGMPCKLADTATEDARLLKYATKPDKSGYCADCGVTDFLKNQSHLAEIMALNPLGKAMLLDLRVQQQFANLMQIGKADAKPETINWQRIYDNWDLPFSAKKRRRTPKKKKGMTSL